MKQLLVILVFFCSALGFSQEEEFLAITVEDKEAFMSTKTGEYVFREHATTNPEELRTTASGVVYNDISTHKVVKGETLSSIAKKHNLTIDQLKKDSKLKSNKLSLGQELTVINRVLVKSSSPVISYAGEERIIAKLRPGQSPSTIAPPPPDAGAVNVVAPEKTTSPNSRKAMSRKSTYYKPMVVPNANSNTEEKEVVEEAETEEESDEVKALKQELEEAKRKLAEAKQKSVEKEAVVEEEVEIKETVIESTEAPKKDAKSQYDAIQEKLEKVKPTTEVSEKEEVKEVEAKIEKEEEVAEVVETPAKPSGAKEGVEGVDYHTIVKGDNLYNLARTYKTTVKKLTELNNVKFNNLKIGQKLKLK